MDDFPAGPASSPAPRRPALSVVVPVHNGGHDLRRCLRGVRASRGLDADQYEIVVVDDGSTDDSAATAREFGARVFSSPEPRGPASARNDGAENALAPIVFFLDADVVPRPDALRRALDRFERDPELSALFGSYDDQPDAPGLVSRYRNLLHHYVHQQGAFVDDARPARTFWTGLGAIRREAFLGLGGFDPMLYRRPAIEDIELGYRLHRAALKVILCRDIQATHLKRWTLANVLKTDVFQRGLPWMLLMMRSKVAETDLNVSRGQRLCVAATGLGLIGLTLCPIFPLAAGLFLVNLAVNAAVNRDFYHFLARRRGWGFALGAFPIHYLYFCCCGLSVALALAITHLPKTTRRPRFDSARRTDAAGLESVPPPRNRSTAPVRNREKSPWIGKGRARP